jgi:putative ABC transport system permease protein
MSLHLLRLAAYSAWSRRFVLGLTLLSIALSVFLLLGLERVRADVRQSFSQSISGTDLVVGARGSGIQLVLYSVFHLGGATSNLSWRSAEAVAALSAVAWTVPISLGDTHRGFAVVGTTAGYFEHLRYGQRQSLAFAQGRRFESLFDAVVGAEVARALGYAPGSRITLSHGDGVLAANEHADKPFTVVGVLAPTGTPVDRSVLIGLPAMEALHVDWLAGAPMPGLRVSPEQAAALDLTPRSITALLVGLKSRAAVFSTQRRINGFADEALSAVLPGVALDELWALTAVGERALLAASALVALVSLAGLVAVIAAGLNERRRELAILRAVGAAPRHVLWLLLLEGALVTAAGLLLGVVAHALAVLLLAPWAQARFGLTLELAAPAASQLALLAAVFVAGCAASLIPGWRAYGLSLADGLSPRG